MSADTSTLPEPVAPVPPILTCTSWGQTPIPAPNVVPMPHGPAAVSEIVRNLFDLETPSCQDGQTLLADRYLCRGGGMLLVGPTGIGKSAAVLQCAISWAAGRQAFGITPSGALRVLLIQSENDDGDLAEMRHGVLAGLELTVEERDLARCNVRVLMEDTQCGAKFIQMLARVLAAEQPDLVVIDPALAYVGASAIDQEAVTTFLRAGLTPLIRRHNCGAIVIHHTNKPLTGKEKGSWQGGDFAYAGAGTAEWANWARAVIVIRSIGRHDVFELVLGKRGGRLGWKQADGVTPSYKRLIGHSKVEGQIFWRELSEEEATEAEVVEPKNKANAEDLMTLVPTAGDIAKNDLVAAAKTKSIGVNRARQFIKALVGAGRLVGVPVPRPGKKPSIHLARVDGLVAAHTS